MKINNFYALQVIQLVCNCFIFERNHRLKIYFPILFFACFFLVACKQGARQPVAIQKAVQAIDYRSKGLEDLTQSHVMKNILCQTWDYKEDVADTRDLNVTSDLEVVYRGYCFFKDGTVVKDPRGNLKIGTWKVNEAVKPITISLEFAKGEKETSQLAYLMPYEMILTTINDKVKKSTTDLSAEGVSNINLKEDPFYRDNVSWRIRPTSPETYKDIKQRLKNCIHFFVLFYDQKINAHSEKITFIGLPSCFTWYAGGIFLQKEGELQQKWINCFYNKEQALQAYHIAGKLLNEKYDWPKKERSWLKLNVAVLKQMENKIDAL